MSSTALISIIMPAYNAGPYIDVAIQSVLAQTYPHWELLVINDGSQDNTEEQILAYPDDRIQYFKQENAGVSAARNRGLAQMKGDFFCFLDADDAFPPKSLESRLALFEATDAVHFVDGQIIIKDQHLDQTVATRSMNFEGPPRPALLRLDGTCFMGVTWMVRRAVGQSYRFTEGLSHGEDLLFFLEISEQGLYKAVPDPILEVRRGHGSAMSNLQGLENGYAFIYNTIREKQWADSKALGYFKYKITRIMVLSYLRNKAWGSAIRSFFRLLFL